MPAPDANKITLTASGTVIGYQGYAGPNVLSTIGIGGKGQDPIDNLYYTYLTNANQTKYQLLGLVENSENAPVALNVPGIDTAYAASYDTRYPVTRWSQLGVLLGTLTGSTLNQPVQELYNAASFTGIDIITATNTTYKAFITPSKILSGTGNVFWELYGRLDPTAGTYPGCDTPNIKLPNGQVWAACNVGATIAYAGQGYPSNVAPTDVQQAYMGAYFQWWRNDDLTAQWTPTATLAPAWTSASTVWHSNFIMNGTTPFDWVATQNDNLWGWQGTTSSTGIYTTQSAVNQTLMQWPCSKGYHVPTQYEWCTAITVTNPAIICGGSWQNDTSIVSVLKLPLAGYRISSSAVYDLQGAYGSYWASSPSATDSYRVAINTTQIGPLSSKYRTFGYSVRCVKN